MFFNLKEKWGEDKNYVYLKSNVFDSDVYLDQDDIGHVIAIPKEGKEAKSVFPVLGLCQKYNLNPFEVLTFISLEDEIIGVTFWNKKTDNEALAIHSKKLK
jgi:hypothetical protein